MNPLIYPCGDPPAMGATQPICPGVHWIRMAMPMTLNHINLWAIKDGPLDDVGAGWAVVDTGVQTLDVANAWRKLFSEGNALQSGPVTRVLVTHMHPDHVGMAGWITRKFDCRMWMTRLEYFNCRVLIADTGREAPVDGVSFYQRAGWSEASLEAYRVRFGSFGRMIHPLPDSYGRL
jgi:glyoxylase-like metal-dependent hydrolase (beta-lactamase superfamily II)